jgi:hypothetical protein
MGKMSHNGVLEQVVVFVCEIQPLKEDSRRGRDNKMVVMITGGQKEQGGQMTDCSLTRRIGSGRRRRSSLDMIPKSQIEMNKHHGHRIKENSMQSVQRGGETDDPGQKENVTCWRFTALT